MLPTRAVSVGALLLASLTISTRRLAAQQPTPPLPGERVRVHFVSAVVGHVPDIPGFRLGGLLEGAFVGTTLDTARLRAANDTTTFAVPLSLVSHIEVHRGRRSNGPKGGALGAGVGGLVAVAAFLSSCKEGGMGLPDCKPAWLLAPVAGGVLGYVIGSLSHSERWEAVPLSGLRVAPVSLNRVGITVSLSF